MVEGDSKGGGQRGRRMCAVKVGGESEVVVVGIGNSL